MRHRLRWTGECYTVRLHALAGAYLEGRSVDPRRGRLVLSFSRFSVHIYSGRVGWDLLVNACALVSPVMRDEDVASFHGHVPCFDGCSVCWTAYAHSQCPDAHVVTGSLHSLHVNQKVPERPQTLASRVEVYQPQLPPANDDSGTRPGK